MPTQLRGSTSLVFLYSKKQKQAVKPGKKPKPPELNYPEIFCLLMEGETLQAVVKRL